MSDMTLQGAVGPLRGLRVVEFGGIGPGPFAAMMLGDAGADVVRIDRRGAKAPLAGRDLTLRSRRSIEIDLKSEAGRSAACELLRRADVLIEGFRPGVMERLGLGPEAVTAINPRLIYGRMTGWGREGPLAPRAGHDINYIALAGALHPIGTARKPPPPPLNLIGDYGGGGMALAFGLLAAVIEARQSGKGQIVDAAMVDGAALLTTLFHGFMADGEWSNARADNILDGAAPFYRCYETADGGFISVGAIEPQFYARLLRVLGLTDEPLFSAQNDRLRWPAQAKRMGAVFAGRSRDAWEEAFHGVDACIAPVLSLDEAAAHPANRARNVFADVDGVLQPGPAPRFSRTPSRASSPPAPGSTSIEAVMREWG